MVVITFPDSETQKKALGFLLGRFSGKVLKNGEHLVPKAALAALADRNGSPSMEKRRMKSKSRRYEVLLPVRFNDGQEVPEEVLGEAISPEAVAAGLAS